VIRTLFLSIGLLYQLRPTQPANFSNFILPADTETYGENRENGGLTRIGGIEIERVEGAEAGLRTRVFRWVLIRCFRSRRGCGKGSCELFD